MPEAHSPNDFFRDNTSVVAWLVCMGLLVLVMFLLDRRWRIRQRRLEQATKVMNESHAYALRLVRHLTPSFKVQKYQFRGMCAKAGSADIAFTDLGSELPSGKRVLQGVTGEFKAGRMCAIMGPSGAGKTTFMNALCGKATYGRTTGSIFVNGQRADISDFKSITGFVPQDDIVHQDLTVREQIEFSARLRNSADLREGVMRAVVEDVLNVMQVDHIQDSIVGSVEKRGISGGQRKRVSIGLEIAAQPTVLFLDEPTSGLDATSSLAVALSLKKMCELGMTSIMVIHQPRYSLFTLFDDVLLLGKGGQTAYLGPSLGAKEYFEGRGFSMPADENPADWFMDIISGEVPTAKAPDFRPDMLFAWWEDAALSSIGDKDLTAPATSGRQLSCAEDCAVLQKSLEEGWDSFDTIGEGSMDAEAFRNLLAQCSSVTPSVAVVQELMERMAGKDAECLTREQFVTHLCSLGTCVAAAASPKTPPGAVKPLDAHGPDLEAGEPNTPPRSMTMPLDPLCGLKREMPCFFKQYCVLVLRRLIQWWRMNRHRSVFVVTLVFGGLALAVLDRLVIGSPRWGAMALLNVHTSLALLISIFCLQVFAADQVVFWRESASGISVPAYFFSRLHMNTIDVLLLSFVFVAVYFAVRQPFVCFTRFFCPFLLTAYAASGWGYFVSTVVPPKHGPFIVSLVVFVICGLLGNPSNLREFLQGGIMEVAVDTLSITRWAIQMNFNYAFRQLRPQPAGPEEQHILQMSKDVFLRGGEFSEQWLPAAVLLAMGTGLRIASFAGLRFTNRDKQV